MSAMNALSSRSAPRRPQPPLVEKELTLGEMLSDAIVIRLMRRDGVTAEEVVSLFSQPRWGLLWRAA